MGSVPCPYDYSNVSDEIHGTNFVTMHTALTELELWGKLRGMLTEFNETRIPNSDLSKLSAHREVESAGHSGHSMMYTLKCMMFIYKNGMDKFIKEYKN